VIDVSLLSTVVFALTAGVATFFSPCAYPLLPGYVGFYVSRTDGDDASLGGATIRGIAAGSGVLGTLARPHRGDVRDRPADAIESDDLRVARRRTAGGLRRARSRRSRPSLSIPLPERRSSVFGFGLFGAGYALAGAGCVAPVFLAVVARSLSLPTEAAALVLLTYVGSIVALMIAVTVATGMGLVASAGRFAAYSEHLKRLAGGLMIVAGVGQLYLALVVY